MEESFDFFDFTWLDYVSAIFGGFLGYFFGGVDGLIYALITCIVFDYITGLLAACVKYELSSQVGFKGIAKKITIFVLVGIANIIDSELLGEHRFLREAVTCFYITNEGLSILENAITIGLPVPNVLKEKLLQFRNNGEKKSIEIKYEVKE